MLAREKIKGPETIFEGPRGFFQAMVPEKPNIERLCADLGQVWRIVETTFKAYPVCGHTMTAVEAAFSVRDEVDPAQISRVLIFSNSTAIRVAGNQNPRTEFQAKFSIPYCVAVALLYGRVTQAEFTSETMNDWTVRNLMERMELVVDQKFEEIFEHARPTRIEVITRGRRHFVGEAYDRKGDPEKPLSREEKRCKFIQLAGSVWAEDVAANLIDRIEDIVELENVGQWLENYEQVLMKEKTKMPLRVNNHANRNGKKDQ